MGYRRYFEEVIRMDLDMCEYTEVWKCIYLII
nr:MAG TPA: hypothetical protein [Caudoviricetes sp.]